MLVRLLLIVVLGIGVIFTSCRCPKEEIPEETPALEEEMPAAEEPIAEEPIEEE